MREYMEKPEEVWDDKTTKIFNSYERFTRELIAVFGEVDEERTAEREIRQLRQTGPASKYTAEFQRIIGKIDWNEEALIAQYYQGLKDSVKDELARQNRPDTFNAMVQIAVRIDNRLYERKLERMGQGSPTNKHRYSKKPGKKSWGDPMEIDAIQRSTTEASTMGPRNTA
jgi:hypothetical protein